MAMVVKVGGSLFDWPALGPKLSRWLNEHASAETLIVPGGGVFADQIRRLDEIHRLSEETAHWMALRAMTMSAGFLSELLDEHGYDLDFSRIETVLDCTESWSRRDRPILDAYAFLSRDDLSSGSLPHSCNVTSDSVAARLAELLGAEVVLLKSDGPPPGDLREWPAAGYVDPFFPTIIERARLTVRAVNLRSF
jgi:aspartokinase-like uncharacterized kinase